jgi:acyl-CoA synthetase (AMP-forming)/AMP-acid ligase II
VADTSPSKADRRPRDLITVIDEPARLDPTRVALIIGSEETTYAALDAAASRCAQQLIDRGATKGSRIALVDDASVLAVATVLGCARIGVACALMNPRLTVPELSVLIDIAGTGALGVAGPGVAESTLAAGVVAVLGSTELLGTEVSRTAASVEVDPEDDAVVLFTSGTTGPPKPVPLTHGLIGPRISAFAPPFDPAGPRGVSLMCVPLVHIGGLLGLLVSLARGQTTVIQTRFDPAEWLELVQTHRVNTAFVVPTMLHRILEDSTFPTTDLSSLAALTYGAAPASPNLIRRAMAAMPHVAFSNVFGQTETLGSITALGSDDHHSERIHSVGRPLPGVQIRVVDPGTGEDVVTGTVGELWVKTEASVISTENARDLSVPPGWLRTGDMISVDADGYLYPAGRLSDTINRGGEKISPSEIEEVLRDHPAVRDVAVGGVPDPEMGSRIGAAVVLLAPTTGTELREFCRGRLANFKLPERFCFVEEIPYNDFGKVSRKALSDLFSEPDPST